MAIAGVRDIVNFRDFGGLSSTFGGDIRPDRLYRSAHPSSLTDEAMERLIRMDFQVVADLRYRGEREGHEAGWPRGYADRILSHDLDRDADAPHARLLHDPALDEAAIPGFYLQFYRTLPFEDPYLQLFADYLDRLSRTDGRTLIHCTIGKDRTGLLAAILLGTLGASRDAIVADYMKSRTAPGVIDQIPEITHILRTQIGRDVSPRLAERLLLVEEDYIVAALDEIDARHGSIDGYLDVIGFDAAGRDGLRERLIA